MIRLAALSYPPVAHPLLIHLIYLHHHAHKKKQLNTELQGEGQRAFSAEEALGIVQAADEAGKLFWEENARIIYQ